jgi:hypothetical protein
MNTDSSVTIREPWLPLPPKPGCAVRRRGRTFAEIARSRERPKGPGMNPRLP